MLFLTLRLCVFALILSVPAAAQKLAILTPNQNEQSKSYAEGIESKLAKQFRILDSAMSEAAFAAARSEENPFNLTTAASKTIGSAIGCDHFILVDAATLRRSSSQRPEYYDSHAAIYAVSARTGRLVFWRLLRYEAAKPQAARNLLDDALAEVALQIADRFKLVTKNELAELPRVEIEEPPDEGSPASKNFKAPIPYRRIKPEYTADAFLYDVRATVDIVVDLDKTGAILRTEIVRWAGYGLDESVEKAVRAMNWRPAMRNGIPLPMRFLLRYNFKRRESQ